jgi:hypothetical protein
VNPNFDVKKWHQCEVLVKEAGSFRAACCPVASDGPAPCKDIWVEVDPTADELVSMK